MSADNWAHCPKCAAVAVAMFAAREAEIEAMYGSVTIEQFDAAREALTKYRAEFDRRNETFREDYEIYGAENGVIIVDYSGQCTKCGLELHFKEEHPIPGAK